MRNNYREDGFVWFEDQISEMADLLITVQGIRYIYLKRRDRSWIERIGDEGMRFALMSMSEIQLRMIEELLFEDKTVTDIRRELNLTITEIRMEIRDMRKALLAAMKPYLSEKRQGKIDRAMKLARLARIAGLALGEAGGGHDQSL